MLIQKLRILSLMISVFVSAGKCKLEVDNNVQAGSLFECDLDYSELESIEGVPCNPIGDTCEILISDPDKLVDKRVSYQTTCSEDPPLVNIYLKNTNLETNEDNPKLISFFTINVVKISVDITPIVAPEFGVVSSASITITNAYSTDFKFSVEELPSDTVVTTTGQTEVDTTTDTTYTLKGSFTVVTTYNPDSQSSSVDLSFKVFSDTSICFQTASITLYPNSRPSLTEISSPALKFQNKEFIAYFTLSDLNSNPDLFSSYTTTLFCSESEFTSIAIIASEIKVSITSNYNPDNSVSCTLTVTDTGVTETHNNPLSGTTVFELSIKSIPIFITPDSTISVYRYNKELLYNKITISSEVIGVYVTLTSTPIVDIEIQTTEGIVQLKWSGSNIMSLSNEVASIVLTLEARHDDYAYLDVINTGALNIQVIDMPSISSVTKTEWNFSEEVRFSLDVSYSRNVGQDFRCEFSDVNENDIYVSLIVDGSTKCELSDENKLSLTFKLVNQGSYQEGIYPTNTHFVINLAEKNDQAIFTKSSFKLNLSKVQLSLTIPSLYCNLGILCTLDMKIYLSSSIEVDFTSVSLKNEPNSSEAGIITIDNQLLVIWTPTGSIQTSGLVTLLLSYLDTSTSTYFEVYVNRPPRIASIPQYKAHAIIGREFRYDINTYDEDLDEILCTMKYELIGADLPGNLDSFPLPKLEDLAIIWQTVQIESQSDLPTIEFTIRCEDIRSIPAVSTRVMSVSIQQGCVISAEDVPEFTIGYENSFFVTVSDSLKRLNEISVDITDNRPTTMSLRELRRDDSSISYEVKWIPPVGSSDVSIMIECVIESIEDISYSSVDLKVSTLPKFDIEISNNPTVEIRSDFTYVGVFTVNREEFKECKIVTGTSQNLYEMTVKKVQNTCELTWTQKAINDFGVKQTDAIRIQAISNAYEISEVSVILYPNRYPLISCTFKFNTEYYTTNEYLIIPFSISDDEPLTYTFSIYPSECSFLIFDSESLNISGVSNLITDISCTFTLEVTDTHFTPLKSTYENTLYFIVATNHSPAFLCPGDDTLEGLITDTTWEYSILPSIGETEIDSDQDELTWILTGNPDTLEIIGTKLIWKIEDRDPTDEMELYCKDSRGIKSNVCRFRLIPDSGLDVVVEELRIDEDEEWIYAAKIKNDVYRVDDLIKTIETDADIKPEINPEGVITWKFQNILADNSPYHYKLILSLTEPDDPIRSSKALKFEFPVTVTSFYSPPLIISPIKNTHPVKQYYEAGNSNLKEDVEYTLDITIFDEKGQYDSLYLSLEYAPSGMIVTKNEGSNEVFQLIWTPKEGQHCSGNVRVNLKHPDIENSYDVLEVILYDILLTEDPPEFITESPIEVIERGDNEYFIYEVQWSDPDTPFEYVEVTLEETGNISLDLRVIGKQTIVRTPTPILQTVENVITLTLTSFGVSSTPFTFTLRLNHFSEKPQITSWRSSYISEDTLTATFSDMISGYSASSLSFCLIRSAPYDDISKYGVLTFTAPLNESPPSITWSDFDFETFTTGIFTIKVSNEENCEQSNSFDSKQLVICRDFTCKNYPQVDDYTVFCEISCTNPTHLIIQHSPDVFLYELKIGNQDCTQIRPLDELEYVKICDIPPSVFGINIPVFVSNGYDLTIPYTYFSIYSSSDSTNYSLNLSYNMPTDLQFSYNSILTGDEGERIKIISYNDAMQDFFSCFININTVWKEGLYIQLSSSVGYCILPELDIGSYSIQVCADEAYLDNYTNEQYPSNMCSNSGSFTVCQKPEFLPMTKLSGKTSGNYSKTVIAKLTECWKTHKPDVYLRFGDYTIINIPTAQIKAISSTAVNAEYQARLKNSPSYSGDQSADITNINSSTWYSLSFTVPPSLSKSPTSLVNIYISVSGIPMHWNSSPAEYEFTGRCISDESSKGKYCKDGELIECPEGNFCDNRVSTVISPTPCPPGSYSKSGQDACTECDVGYICDRESMISPVICPAGWVCNYPGIDFARLPCPPGFYCPEGTNSYRVNYKLNPGNLDTYTDYYILRDNMTPLERIQRSDHWYNRGQFFDINEPNFKKPGYIPECIKEYYEKGLKAENDDDASSHKIARKHPIVCSSGKFCLWATTEDKEQSDSVGGKVRWFSSRSCSMGFVCNSGFGESFDNDLQCTNKYFSPGTDFDHPLCRSDPLIGDADKIDCQLCRCPEGFMCPLDGMKEPTPCPAGTFQDLCEQTTCQECPEGYYCTDGTNRGILSAQNPPDLTASNPPQTETTDTTSTDTQTTDTTTDTSSTDTTKYKYLDSTGTIYKEIVINMYRCRQGHYCPKSSASPMPCKVGEYQDEYGKSTCKICPKGSYCPSKASINANPCAQGYVCATEGLTEGVICPAGFYCEKLTDYIYGECTKYNIDSCAADPNLTYICPANSLCPKICQPGYKCPSGSFRPIECPQGYYQPNKAATSCLECPKGYFCPLEATITPTICTAGFCCSQPKLPTPNGQCPGGYVCGSGTIECKSSLQSLPNRQLQILTDCNFEENISRYMNGMLQLEPIICTPGTYCPAGSSVLSLSDKKGPRPCLKGSYNSYCGEADCKVCGDGFECLEVGLTAPELCKPGYYRNGSNIECLKCEAGRFGNGIRGLVYAIECPMCPEGYMCSTEGIGSIDELELCTEGFYCLSGTSIASNLCPEGTFCPPGVKNEAEALLYKCPAGRFCTEGTSITLDQWNECKDDISKCLVGQECPANKYCPQGTGTTPESCPTGTISTQGTTQLDLCSIDPRRSSEIYSTVSAYSQPVSLDPLSWNVFELDTTSLPENAQTPEDFILMIDIQSYDDHYRIPFIDFTQDYTPKYKIPMMNSYKDYLSNSSSIQDPTIEFIILAHRSLNVTFEIEILNGLYTDPEYITLFKNCIYYIQTLYPQREHKKSFLTILNRNTDDEFKEPANLAISDEMTRDPIAYKIAKNVFVTAAGLSVISELGDISSDVGSTDLVKLWDEVSIEQKLYPLDYVPYVTDCEGWGSYLPIYLLVNYTECKLLDTSDTVPIKMLNPLKSPQGDECDFTLTCNFAENISKLSSYSKSLWFEASEISNSVTFYISREQFTHIDYESYTPSLSSNDLSFTHKFYGSGKIIEVKAERHDLNYEKGMVPRKVKLSLGYYQKNQFEKEILKARLHFDEFDEDLTNRQYKFQFELYPLEFIECLNLFAFESYLYYFFIFMMCLVILGFIILFWGLNYVFSRIAPKPRLKTRLYFFHSMNSLKGILMGCIPPLGLIFGVSQFIITIEFLKYYTGDHDDTEPINPNNPVDLTRIDKYTYGRTAWVFCIAGWYMILKGTFILFPNPIAVERQEDRTKLHSEVIKLRGLFIWQLVLILIFCIAAYQFSQSDVFKQNSTYFIIVFKLVNLKLVDIFSGTMNDELYVLPYFGAMSLTIMMITVEVGEFTKFLQGYLTQISIKIFKRAFVEPSRLDIKNRIIRFKARLGMKTGTSEVEGLSFKDQVYVEQVQDLGTNSMEYIAAWLFPTMIVFQYYFYDLLKIPTSKEFFQYFIILSFIQAFAEIFYDIFLNNAIECKTGRLLSEKITDLSLVFKSRLTLWALSDSTPHLGKKLLPSQNTIQRLGFSTQHYFIMSFLTLGCMLQVFSYQIWIKWNYNPFKDPTILAILPIMTLLCYILEKIVIYAGRKFSIWTVKKREKKIKVADFYESIQYYVDRELESQVRYSREEVLNYSIARAILDQYKSVSQEHKRQSLIIRFLKKIEQAYRDLSEKQKENREEVLELPKVRQRTHYLVVKSSTQKLNNSENQIKQESSKLKCWPDALIYQW